MEIGIIFKKSIKFYFLIFILILFSFCAKAQSNDWYAFRNPKTDLIGFKNKKGVTEIPAKFDNLSKQAIFKNVIAVHDYKSGHSYYLLKNGERFGTDSMYVYDNGYDEENEGKIRFRDNKTDKVGFFDIKGKIVIPANYDDAQPFHNGFALVTHNGKRVCLDGSIYNSKSPCENWAWNGKTALIDAHNHIISDNIPLSELSDIDWYKLKITKSQPDTALYTSFKTKNGSYYSFLNYKKEFTKWFNQVYLINLNYKALNSCYRKVSVEEPSKKKITAFFLKSVFLRRYQSILIKEMQAIKTGAVSPEIFSAELNDYIFTYKQFPNFYYFADGNPYKKTYPIFNVVITYVKKEGKLNYQNQFTFIRIENSYQLIEVALNVGKEQ